MRKSLLVLCLELLALAWGCSPLPRHADTPDSTTVAVTPTGRYLVLDADHDTLVMLHPVTRQRETLALPGTPGRMAVRGHYAVVSLPYQRQLAVVDWWRWHITRTVDVGVEPMDLGFVGAMDVAVVLQGERALALVDVGRGKVDRRIDLPMEDPHGLAVTSEGVAVADRMAGRVAMVNLADGAVVIRGLPGASPTQTPTLVQGLTWVPSIKRIWAASPQLESGPDGRPAFSNGTGAAPQYYGEKLPPAVGLAMVDQAGQDERGLPLLTEVEFDPGARLQPYSEPVATAVVDDGRGLAVLFRGSREVVFFARAPSAPGTFRPCGTPSNRVGVGHGADGMAITPDGDHLVVHNASDLTVGVVAVPVFSPVCPAGTVQSHGEPMAFAELTLPKEVVKGRRMFMDGTNTELTRVGLTCVFCHVDGLSDGRVWAAPGGPRNTPSLAGAGPGRVGIASTTAPLHWTGEFATAEDMTGTVTNVMVGDGITAEKALELAAFVDTIRTRDTGAPTTGPNHEAAQRGQAIFEDTRVGCQACHGGDHLTDNLNHSLGLTPDSVHAAGFQTPVLHNLARTAPYFHDGTSASLEDVVEYTVRTDKMGKGSHLTDAQRADLVAYLRTL